MKSVWVAAGAVFLLVAGACAPPRNTGNLELGSPTPTPSPSPTPTTAFGASGPGFHAGEVGVGYAPVALTAGGGVQPYRWSVSTGALPPGLSLGNDGKLAGSPTAAGSYSFTIQASDSGDSTAAIPGAIKIVPRLTATLLPACAQYCNVELGCANACGAFGQYSGGLGPYTFAVKQGPLPVGTALSPNTLTLNGTFGGQTGFLQFTAQVGDAFGATATVSPTFWIYPHIALASDSTTCFYIWTACSMQLRITGGVPNGRPSVALVSEAPQPGDPKLGGCWNQQNPLPLPQYNMSVGNGTVTIYIPRPSNGYGGVWTLVLTDHTLCAPATNCTSQPAVAHIGINCT